MLNTERLRIYPASREQMEVMTASEQDEELRKAYTEMLEGCLRNPDQWDWYAIWMIEKTDGTHIGDLSFKGLREDGIAEIGYGILEEYRGQGYAAEAVQAACRWAFQQEGVKSLEAETDARNFASQRVLQKCGFHPTGTNGEEGPRFTLNRPNHHERLPKVSFSRYRDEDYEAVCIFLIELNQKDRTHINWNWARFELMMEHPEFDKSAGSSIGLWWSEGKVVGAAIYDMYFGEAFCGALPEHDALYPEILDYAYRELKDDSGLGITVHDGNKAEIEAAKTAGFVRTDQRETVMRLDLNHLISSDLPEGFTLSELDPAQEAYEFQWLLWQGFDHGENREVFEREDPIIPQSRRHLNKRLSLTALAQDGGKAAYCCVWFRPDTDYAYVEPVCTIPSCRGKGIAAALLSEALNRAKSLGAKEAYVISDLPFYEKLGFEKAQQYSFYWKEK